MMTGDMTLPEGSAYNYLFTFKHPSTVGCTHPGKCGFIVRYSEQDDDKVIYELNTNSEDYNGTGLHLHDIISTRDMYLRSICSGNIAPGKKVQVGGFYQWWQFWLPNVFGWEFQRLFLIHDIYEYHVSKRDSINLL